MPRKWYWIYRFWTWTTRAWIPALGKLPSVSSCGLTCKVRDGWYICIYTYFIGLLEGLDKFICVKSLSRWLVVKNPPANAEAMGSIPGEGRSPGGGNGNLLQYSCWENPHGHRSLAGQSMGLQRVRQDWPTQYNTTTLIWSLNTEPDIQWVVKQFSSVAQSCPTLCDTRNYSMPGLPVHHQLPESTQTHVHQVSDAI